MMTMMSMILGTLLMAAVLVALAGCIATSAL